MKNSLTWIPIGAVSLCLGGCLGVDVSSRNGSPSLNTSILWENGGLGIDAAVTSRPFPATNVWNTDISGAAVDPNSAAILAGCGSGHLQAAFGAPNGGNNANGLSYVVVDSSQPLVPVAFNEATGSDAGPYPIPANAPIGDGNSNNEGQVIVVVRDVGKLYEMNYAALDASNGSWQANAGAIFDLSTGALRPDGSLSAQTSGMPIFPGLVRADEVLDQKVIAHALAFSCPNNADSHVAPATANLPSAPGSTGTLPAMGIRVRLRADFDLNPATPYPASVLVILTALQKYGMFLSDNGPAFWLSGTADSRWSNDDLSQLANVLSTDLEVVQ
jgi:hypothetical protein